MFPDGRSPARAFIAQACPKDLGAAQVGLYAFGSTLTRTTPAMFGAGPTPRGWPAIIAVT